MDAKKRILVTLGLAVVLVAGFFLITEAITKYTGFFVSEMGENDFEVCLDEKDILLYVNTNNLAQTLRTIELIDYLEYVEITNCLRDNQNCLEKNINSFPTWIIEDNIINRDITLEKLSELSECRMTKS